MSEPDSRPRRSRFAWWSKPFAWLLAALGMGCRLLLIAWASLAIFYSNLPWAQPRLWFAIAFAVFGLWTCFVRPRRFWLFACGFLGVLLWWLCIRPSQDRPWRPEVAVLPRAYIDGDRVRITGCRDFDYRTRDDFTVRYVEREVSVSHLTSLDFFVSYWAEGPVGHTFLSFNFDNAPPLSISIETRPEIGEGFNPIASLFKQFELIYVVGNERDLVRVRTNFRNETVYLYPLRIPAENARRLFLIYLGRINELAARPEFYHLLSNSCTVNIVRYANAAGRVGRFDFRHLLNGFIDRYLFSAGLTSNALPFEELRLQSLINPAALAADAAPDFSERIRAGLPPLSR